MADVGPVPTTGVQPQSSINNLNSFVQQMLLRMGQSHLGAPPGIGPNQPSPQAGGGSQIIPGRSGKGGGKAFQQEMGQKVANDIMGGVQSAVQQHKQKQVNEATAMWMSLQAAHERLTAAGQVGPNGQVDLMKDPVAASILTDPKRMKNMAKAFNVDFLNPEKTNVYAEGLKKAMRLDKAGKMVKVMRSLHLAKQQQPQVDQQAVGKEIGGRIEGMSGPQGIDPKVIEGLSRIVESNASKQEALEFRKMALQQNLDMRQQQLNQQKQNAEMMHQDRKDRLDQMSAFQDAMLDIRRAQLQLNAEKATLSGDVSSLADQVLGGFPISQLSAKDRASVVKEIDSRGLRVPTPFNNTEQVALDNSLEQVSKIRAWKSQLESITDDHGQMSNKPFGMTWDRLKYWAGQDTPEGAMISDFSRERWAAIAGLVKGVRRGDILKDMVLHTPDPWRDSVKLAHTKLNALEANYNIARATALKEHGFTKDPVTGTDIDSDIKSYEDHLKLAKEDEKREGLGKYDKYRAK